jgi:hypothetical protein
MELLRKLLFNIDLCHNPLCQDSFGPRKLGIAKGPACNEHPLLFEVNIKPDIAINICRLWEVNLVDASLRRLNLGITHNCLTTT